MIINCKREKVLRSMIKTKSETNNEYGLQKNFKNGYRPESSYNTPKLIRDQ